jgi:hypothetical protein
MFRGSTGRVLRMNHKGINKSRNRLMYQPGTGLLFMEMAGF